MFQFGTTSGQCRGKTGPRAGGERGQSSWPERHLTRPFIKPTVLISSTASDHSVCTSAYFRSFSNASKKSSLVIIVQNMFLLTSVFILCFRASSSIFPLT